VGEFTQPDWTLDVTCHGGSASRATLSRAHDELTILHVRVNRTEDITIHPEAPNFVCDKGHCVSLSGSEAETPVIVVSYCESMYFSAIIVDDCNNYGVALMDSNDRPLCR
jgi:hypothetical protein